MARTQKVQRVARHAGTQSNGHGRVLRTSSGVPASSREVVLQGKVTAESVGVVTIEIAFCFIEFFFAIVFLRDIGKSLVSTITGNPKDELGAWPWLAVTIFSDAGAIYWSLLRHAMSLKTTVRLLLKERFGCSPVRVSGVALSLIAIHIASNAAMVAFQYWSNRWIFSLENYHKDGHLDVPGAVSMLLVAPVREELMFRCIMSSIFRRRLGPSPWMSCVLPSALFGAIHLLNLLGPKHSLDYVTLQVALGFLIGLFYCLRLQLTGCVWETVAMHIVNNVLSSFLPLDAALDMSEPFLLFALLGTLVVYTVMIQRSWETLCAQLESAQQDDGHAHEH